MKELYGGTFTSVDTDTSNMTQKAKVCRPYIVRMAVLYVRNMEYERERERERAVEMYLLLS